MLMPFALFDFAHIKGEMVFCMFDSYVCYAKIMKEAIF